MIYWCPCATIPLPVVSLSWSWSATIWKWWISLVVAVSGYRRAKIFKNGSSKICGRQSLRNLKKYSLLKADHNWPFFNTLSQIFIRQSSETVFHQGKIDLYKYFWYIYFLFISLRFCLDNFNIVRSQARLWRWNQRCPFCPVYFFFVNSLIYVWIF